MNDVVNIAGFRKSNDPEIQPHAAPPKLILLNGPPRAGKDTAARAVVEELAPLCSKISKMTTAMEQAIKVLFSLSDEDWIELREDKKDVPDERLHGATMRQILISFSEDFLKKCCGQDIYGKLAKENLCEDFVVVFSDCGFQAEIDHLVNHFGKENVMLVRIHKKGCSFEGDSRNWVYIPGAKEIDVWNDSTIFEFQTIIQIFARRFVMDELPNSPVRP